MPRSSPARQATLQSAVDLEHVAGRIAGVTGIDVGDAVRRLRREHEDVGSTVREALAARGITPHVWSDALADFYGTTDAFFYELVVWNGSTEKAIQREWILRFLRERAGRTATVLMYGDGLGFDGIFLRRAGYSVTCFEVSPRYRAFAEAAFADAGVSVEWLDREESLRGRTFDAIVCLDVLEHVPDPPRLVATLTALLAPDGILIVHAPFWHVTRDASTHLAANRCFSGDVRRLYSPSGLVPIDARWMWNPIAFTRRSGRGAVRTWAGVARVLVGAVVLRFARWLPYPFDVVGRWLLQGDALRRSPCLNDAPRSPAGAQA